MAALMAALMASILALASHLLQLIYEYNIPREALVADGRGGRLRSQTHRLPTRAQQDGRASLEAAWEGVPTPARNQRG